MMQLPFEQFPALNAIEICRHIFTQRIPGINVAHNKSEALSRLDVAHREIRRTIGMADWPVVTVEQIHGNGLAILDTKSVLHMQHNAGSGIISEPAKHFAGCDGIITDQHRVALGIHVADCCAVYIVDQKTPAIGLVHSGRKGTELGVVRDAITQMIDDFGSAPANMIVQLSPCIRPPHYETDFAAEIVLQCRALGVKEVHDSGVCTACDLDRYYSYRAEKGRTGRMLALLGLNPKL